MSRDFSVATGGRIPDTAEVMKEDDRAILRDVREALKRLEVAISGDELGNQGLLGMNRQIQVDMKKHEAEDDRRFSEATADRMITRVQLAKYAGGIAALTFILGIVATVIAAVK